MLILQGLIYLFDCFIRYIYLENTMHRRDKLSYPVYVAGFLLSEAGILIFDLCRCYIGPQLFVMLRFLLGFFLMAVLSCMYECSLYKKIKFCGIFQIAAVLVEHAFDFIMLNVNPGVHIESVITLGSELMLLIICSSVFSVRADKKNHISIWNTMISIITPLVSVVILLFMPDFFAADAKSSFFGYVLLSVLVLLNISMYSLQSHIYCLIRDNLNLLNMKQQMEYQSLKFEQLSTTYRTSRRIIHDVKKHYLVMENYVKKQQYEELCGYLHIASENLEDRYLQINSGNLVIDTFISTYKELAKNNNINFVETIIIEQERIPVDSYDLCIILGNLLDNSLEACRKCNCAERTIYIKITTNSNNTFSIITKNSYSNNDGKAADNMEHGYGLSNIISITGKYNGVIDINAAELFEVCIVLPV